LVFVLPAASRVMHSNLNARLLMQYSNSLGKKTSVVSPDSRTQGVAIETGFDTFPSMAAFEAGRALDRAVAARTTTSSPIAAGALGAGALSGIPGGSTRRSTVAPGPVPVPRPKPAATRPAAAAAAASTVAAERRIGFLPWVLGAAGIFLIAMILLFFVLPSATVTIIVSARPVSNNPTITGSTQPPPADQPLAVQTTIQQAQEQQVQAVTSTGVKVIPAVPAQVVVTITNHPTPPFGGDITLKKGLTYEVVTNDGKKFHVVPASDVTIPAGSTSDVTFTAAVPGTSGNIGPHTVTTFTGAPSQLTVDNNGAGNGGVDQQNKTVVAQADIDKTKGALGATLTQKVKDDIKGKGGTDTVLPDTESVDVSINTDKQPGDEVPTFNATVTAKGRAITVSDAKMKALLLAALNRQVISGYHLTNDKPKLVYTEVQHDDTGAVIWDGTASGFMATAINDADLRSKISGKSPKEAGTYIQGHLDARAANVSISPPFVPWLPFIGGNIQFREQVENTTPAG
jgi:hypothetical protein